MKFFQSIAAKIYCTSSWFIKLLFPLHKSFSGSLSKIIYSIYRKESQFNFKQLFSVGTTILIKGATKYYCQKNSCYKMCLIDELCKKLGVIWRRSKFRHMYDYTMGWRTLEKLYSVHSYKWKEGTSYSNPKVHNYLPIIAEAIVWFSDQNSGQKSYATMARLYPFFFQPGLVQKGYVMTIRTSTFRYISYSLCAALKK